MKNFVPHFGATLLLLVPACPLAGQIGSAAPQGSASGNGAGGNGPSVAPDLLSYSLTVSNSLVFGYNGVNGASDSVNLSGNAGYASGSEKHPTSFVYSGGYLFGNNGQPSTGFQNLGVSQVLNTGKWNFVASDVVSYLPATPRFGLAGLPGVGDIGSQPIETGQAGDALLTNYGQRLTNNATGSANYRLNGRDSIDAFGGYTNQHFFNGVGISNNMLNAGAQFNHRLSAATTVGGAYTYTHSTYPTLSNLSFNSNGLLATYQHIFNAKLSMQASAGPQWTSGSNSGVFPTRLSLAAGLGVNYAAGRNNYALNYNRGTSTGSGVLLGALTDYISFSGQRSFTENWSAGVFSGYGHSRSLSDDPALFTTTNSFTAGLQGTRRLGEHLSAYGSYSLQYQNVGQLLATNNAFDGTAHVISFGVTYAPRPIHLGRR